MLLCTAFPDFFVWSELGISILGLSDPCNGDMGRLLLAKNCYIIQEMSSSFSLTLGAFPGNDCPLSLPEIEEVMSKSHCAILQAL